MKSERHRKSKHMQKRKTMNERGRAKEAKMVSEEIGFADFGAPN